MVGKYRCDNVRIVSIPRRPSSLCVAFIFSFSLRFVSTPVAVAVITINIWKMFHNHKCRINAHKKN